MLEETAVNNAFMVTIDLNAPSGSGLGFATNLNLASSAAAAGV